MSQMITRFLKDRRPVLDDSNPPPTSQAFATQTASQIADAEESLFVTPNNSFSGDIASSAPSIPTVGGDSRPTTPKQPSGASSQSTPYIRATFAINFEEVWVNHKQ